MDVYVESVQIFAGADLRKTMFHDPAALGSASGPASTGSASGIVDSAAIAEFQKQMFALPDAFVTTDTIRVVVTFAASATPGDYYVGWEMEKLIAEPDTFEWHAYMFEHFLPSDGASTIGTVIWAAEGTADFSYGAQTVEIAFSGPFLGTTIGLRDTARYLDFHFGWQIYPLVREWEVIGRRDWGALPKMGDPAPIDLLAHSLFQTERDALRQEYIDFSANTIPSREDVKLLVSPYNVSNFFHKAKPVPAELSGVFTFPSFPEYGLGLDAGMANAFDSVTAAFRNRPVIEAPTTPDTLHLLNSGLVGNPMSVQGQPVFINPQARIRVASAYRNPRRNVAVKSKYPITSKHVWGRALDLVPEPGTTGVLTNGTNIPLDLHRHLFPTLLQAARAVHSSSIGEDGAQPVPIGDHSEDHVHIQW